MSRNSKQSVFENNNISGAILSMALPTIISQLITTVYNLADTFWVGRLNNPDQLAALAIIFPMQMLLTALGNLFGIGAGTSIAVRLGMKDERHAKQASSFAIYFGCFTALLLSLAVLFFRNGLLVLLGSTSVLDAYAAEYLDWVILWGAVPSVFNLIVAGMLRGEGCSFEASLGLSGGGILNMILDPFFVLPFALGMEIKGAAIATLISNLATTVYFLIVIIRRRGITQISFDFHVFSAAREMGRNVIFTGIPSALQTLLSAVSNLALNKLMIGFSETAEAAVGIIKKVDAIPMSCLQGLAQGAAPLIAYNFGAGRRDRMKKTFRLTMIYGICSSLVILAAVEIFAKQITGAFTSDAATVEYATGFLRLHCMSMPFMVVTMTLIAFFQSVGAKGRAFVLSLIRKGIVDIPLMFLMNAVVPMYGIIACQPITDVVSASCGVILFVLWRKNFRMLNSASRNEQN